jgi:hypothetical protein
MREFLRNRQKSIAKFLITYMCKRKIAESVKLDNHTCKTERYDLKGKFKECKE